MNDYLAKSYGIFEVRGAAGAGKTYQLCRDMEDLSERGKKGVVISFSNTAVDELSERSGNDNVLKRTIHSFCWYVLSSVRMKILNSNRLKNLFVPEAFRGEGMCFDSQTVNEIIYGSEEKAYPFYDESSKRLGLSHDDVINLFNLAIDTFPTLSNLVTKSIDFMLIDEYQDSNLEFLKRIFKYLSPKILVGLYGDPLQSVYSSKRSRISQLGFSINQETLPENHRSAKRIVDFLNELRSPFDGLHQSTSIPGGVVEVVRDDCELNARMAEVIGRKYHFISGKSMILSLTNFYRTNAFDFGIIAKYIKNVTLPQLTNSKKHQWSEVTNTSQLNSRLRMLIKYLKFEFSTGYSAAQSFLDIYTPESISSVDITKVSKIKANANGSESTLIQDLEDLGLEYNAGWNSVIDVVKLLQPQEAEEIYQFYRSLDGINGVSQTIPFSKGQEFESVILNIDSNWSDRNWNEINFDLSEIDESDNRDILSYLMYVGVSRAKENLIIFVNTHNEKVFLKKFHEHFPDVPVNRIWMSNFDDFIYPDKTFED